MTKVNLYTDGACSGNPGVGGYGAILVYTDNNNIKHEKELSQGYRLTTNNQMELMAVIAGLETLKRSCEVTVYSDSKYVVDAFNNNWIDGWIAKGWKTAGKSPGPGIPSAAPRALPGHSAPFAHTGSPASFGPQ